MKTVELNKTVNLDNYNIGDKWNESYTVVDKYEIALVIAETFSNGNTKKTTKHYVFADGKVSKV